MEGGRGGKERDRRVGEAKVEEEDAEKGNLRFFREKDCWAWEKWTGMGRGVVATLGSMVTDIMLADEGFCFLLKQ